MATAGQAPVPAETAGGQFVRELVVGGEGLEPPTSSV